VELPVRSRGGNSMITDSAGILTRWAEHFNSVLNQRSQFDDTVLSEIPDWEVDDDGGLWYLQCVL